MDLRRSVTNRLSRTGAVALVGALLIALLIVVPRPAAADLADSSGSYGVAGVDTSFGARPNAGVAVMETIGNRVYVGGKFTSVTRNGNVHDDQSYLAAFDATTGEYLASFDPQVDGPVNAMAVYDGKLLIGGQFSNVDGQNRPAMALLDPATGRRAELPFGVYGGNPANVRDFAIEGQYLYAIGSFNQATASGQASPVGNVVRFNTQNTTVDTGWRASITGSGWGIATDPANGRVYFAAFQAGGFIAVNDGNGAAVQVGTGTSLFNPYDVVVHQGKIWVGGSNHLLVVLDAATMRVISQHGTGRVGQGNPWNGGDFQTLEAIGNRVYAGCHCNYEEYRVGENVRRPISFLLAYDATTTDLIPSFDPHMLADSGPWAITEGPGGCVWTAGEIRKSGYDKVDNLARLCDMVSLDGSGTDVAPAATFSSGPGWYELDLGQVRGIANVDVNANLGDHFIMISETPFRNDKTAAELAGMDGYAGTRMLQTSEANNRRWFNLPGRYVRIYTRASVTKANVAVRVTGAPVAVADGERPSVPRDMVLSTDGSDAVTVNWSASTDNVGVVRYDVYRSSAADGPFEVVGTAPDTTYVDAGLDDGTYWYYLRAADAAGNVSWRNGIRSVEVSAGGAAVDTERPTYPLGLKLAVTDSTNASLTWTASTDNVGVVGYDVYRSTSADGSFEVVGRATDAGYVDSGLAPGDYFYYVRAVDAAGNISWRSNIVNGTFG
ncbi:MAG: hypothetical protein ACK5PP_05440 [Acidimicrobiales bacterium]